MDAKQRIVILTMLLLVVLLLFSCVGRGIPMIAIPDLEDPEVLNALVKIITGDDDVLASELTDETTLFNLEGEDAFSFFINPIDGIEFTVIFRDQVHPPALVGDVLVYEIDVSTTAAGVYEIIIRAARATLIPPDQITPRNENMKEATLWIEVFHPPLKPFNPQPEDGAENQPIEGVVLRWDCGDPEGDPLTYMVYLCKEEEDLEWIATITETNHPLPELEYDTQYFWRVYVDDGRTSEPRELTEGDVWTFKTQTQPFTLTLNRNNNAWGTVTGGGAYVAGAEIEITTTPNPGYRFVEWEDSFGSTISTDTTHAFTMPAANVTLLAVFEEIFALTLKGNPEGVGVLEGAGNYPAGAQVEVSADAGDGFDFVDWRFGTSGGELVSVEENFSYVMPAKNVTLVATFHKPVTAITVSGKECRVSVGVGVPLQMFAEVNPEDATNKEVTWSVENVGGISPRENRAEITQTGVLKGLTTGIVDVKATAKDGSGAKA